MILNSSINAPTCPKIHGCTAFGCWGKAECQFSAVVVPQTMVACGRSIMQLYIDHIALDGYFDNQSELSALFRIGPRQ